MPATRLATISDIAKVIELERRTENAAHWGPEQYEAVFQPEPRRLMIVVEEEKDVRGFLVASALGPDWEVENVVVDPQSRRRGLGTGLLADLIQRARVNSAEAIYLEVRKSNISAQALYKRFGFVQTGRRTAYFRNPPEDAILYRLSLE